MTDTATNTLPLALCWPVLGSNPPLDELVTAAAGHYQAITVSPRQFSDALAAGHSVESIRARLRERGLVVDYVDPVVVGLPGIPGRDDAVWAGFTSYLDYDIHDGLRTAVALESRSINVAHLFGDPATDQGALLAALRPMAAAAAAESVGLLLEFMPGTGIGSLATAAELAAELGGDGPPVGITFDTWHFARSGGQTEDLTRDLTAHVGAVQLSDGHPGPPDTVFVRGRDRLLPGAGRLDLAGQVERIMAAAPAARIGVEVISQEIRALDPRVAAATTARAARDALSGPGTGERGR